MLRCARQAIREQIPALREIRFLHGRHSLHFSMTVTAMKKTPQSWSNFDGTSQRSQGECSKLFGIKNLFGVPFFRYKHVNEDGCR